MASIFRPGGDRGRLLLWRNTLDLVAHHPVLGVGLGNWSVHYPYYDHGDRIRFDTAPERPHNDLLGILSETGLPGFLAYLWLGVTAFSVGWTLLRSPSLETRCIAAACLAGLLAISVHSLFSFPRERMAPTVFFWLTLGLLGTLHPASNSRFARGVAAKTVGLFLLLLLLLQAGIGIRFAQFETRMHRATAAQRRGDLLNTVHETGTAIRAGRFHPEVLHLRGFALNQTGQFTSAYELYTQALEARPYDIQLLNGMAIACQNLEKTGAAIAAYTRALELVPNLPDVWYNLALLYMQTGQTESALQACLKAVDLSPNDAQFYVALGELYARSGRVPEALDAYRAFLRHWTGDPRHAETVRTRIANLSTRIAE